MKRKKSSPPREVRISVLGLRPGMYVSRLDRPWSESPYRLHGFNLRDEAAVQALQKVCQHVYVDTASGLTPEPRFQVFEEPLPPKRIEPHDAYSDLHRHDWPQQHGLRAELAAAESALLTLRHADALASALPVAVAELKAALAPALDSILRNPSALPWLHALACYAGEPMPVAITRTIWVLVLGRSLGLDRSCLRQLALAALLSTLPGDDGFEAEANASPNTVKHARERLARALTARLAELGPLTGLPPQTLEALAHHRARHDGQGHPLGEAGEAIPVLARLLGLVAHFATLTRAAGEQALTPYRAGRRLYDERGRLWDPRAVDHFVQACGLYPVGSLVELSSGEIAVVVEIHPTQRLRPKLRLLFDRQGQPLRSAPTLDLASGADDTGAGVPVTLRSDRSAAGLAIDWSRLRQH